MIYYLQSQSGTDTAGFYIRAHKKYLMGKFGFKNIYPGTINFKSVERIILPKQTEVKINYCKHTFWLCRCKVDDVKGWLAEVDDEEFIYEFFTDREIVITDLMKVEICQD